MSSRGPAISAYNAAFSKGAKIYGDNIQSGTITSAKFANDSVPLTKLFASQITGTVISAGPTYAIAHGLGKVPSLVVVGAKATPAQLSAKASVGEVTVSARTSTHFYVAGAPKGVKFVAYVQI